MNQIPLIGRNPWDWNFKSHGEDCQCEGHHELHVSEGLVHDLAEDGWKCCQDQIEVWEGRL